MLSYIYSYIAQRMVARDGIEPPTPAFSGPRSTTELPGLSADFWLHGYRVESGGAGEGGLVHLQFAATTGTVYQHRNLQAKPVHRNACTSRRSLLYTGRQSCAGLSA